MLKDRLDYKLVNLALIALISYIVYKTGDLWLLIFAKTSQIITPFLFAFAIAYAIHPFLQKLIDRDVPKWLGVLVIIMAIFFIISFVIYLIATVMFNQLSSLFSGIISFIGTFDSRSIDLNVAGLETTLSETFRSILANLGSYVSDGAINIVNASLGVISKVFIIFAAFIYFLIDMDKIREEIKFFFKKRSKKVFEYVRLLDLEMKKYLSGLIQIIMITFVEYTLVYTLIGHPNAILLGFLAALGNLIPYFGGIAVNIIAAITAATVSPALLIRTVIAFVVLSSVDSYVINPTVYGKTNSIHPLITIVALFAGGIIFGIMGVFISFPLAIVVVTTYKYFKEDIKENIKKAKNN